MFFPNAVFFKTGANQSPSNFHLSPLNSTSVLASWELPSTGSIQGIKLLYKIKNTEYPFTTTAIASNSTISTSVTSLGKFTEYEFHVLAFTANGNGPLSPVKVVRTNEDGKTIPYHTDLATSIQFTCKLLLAGGW